MRGNYKEMIGLLARLLAGGVFVYAGLIKVLSPAEEFAYAIESYRVLNSQLSLRAAYLMPWLELYTGLLLMAGVFTRYAALLTGAMLVFFELLLGQAWLRGLPVTSCGCFGSGGSNSLAGEFAQNIPLLVLAALAFYFSGGYSVDSALDGGTGMGLADHEHKRRLFMEKKNDEKKPARKGLWAVFRESMDKASGGCGPGCGCHDAAPQNGKERKNTRQDPEKGKKRE